MLSLPPKEVVAEETEQTKRSLRWLDRTIKIVLIFLAILLIAFGSYYVYSQYLLSQKSIESQAIREAKEAIRRSPRDPDARVRLGILYLQDDRYDEAITRFNEALKITKDHQAALVYVGVTYLRKHQYAQALKYFDKEIKYYKNTMFAKSNLLLEQAYYYGGVALWKQKKYDKALDYLNYALEIKSTSADTYLIIGRIQLERKSYDEGIKAFNEALRFDPKYVDALYGLGLAYEGKGDKAEALKKYKEALKSKPDFKEAQEAVRRLEKK